MAVPQEKTYDLPRPTTLRLFRNLETFRKKAEDHLLCATEPWHRLLGVKFLRKVGKKLTEDSVSTIRELYDRMVPLVDDGIRFSSEVPVYVEFRAKWRRFDGHEEVCNGFYFLSEFGFIVVARSGIVRTAYFPSKHSNESYFTLFNEAWRAIRIRAAHKQYIDSKGGRKVEHLHVNRVNEKNWKKCPNPHKKPRRERCQVPPDAEAWLNDVDQIFSNEGEQ